MTLLLGELHHLILDGWAVSGAGAFYHACIDGGTVQIGPDYLMGLLTGIGEITVHLLFLHALRIGGKRKRDHRHVSVLRFHL